MRVRHYKMEHVVPYSLSNRSAASSRRTADDGEQQASAEWGDKPVAREKRQYYENYARADVTQVIVRVMFAHCCFSTMMSHPKTRW